MVNRRIVAESIKVNKDGDPLDRGELYWAVTANNSSLTQRSRNDILKVRNGDTIFLGNQDLVVSNLEGSDTLTIQGFVAERDGIFSSDEQDDFRHIYSQQDQWGLGSYQVILQDTSSFDVVFSYRIENI